jgi:L-methionine (R)-S-oxide reductase
MAESFDFNIGGSKSDRYQRLLTAIRALIEPEVGLVANLANVSAALKQSFNWWWVGFYLVKDKHLILGPFQGPVACTTILYGKGVCGRAWELNNTVIVDNVDLFPGHIACSAASKSEIVVPIRRDNQVVAVLDIDSELLACFDRVDQEYLELLCELIGPLFKL